MSKQEKKPNIASSAAASKTKRTSSTLKKKPIKKVGVEKRVVLPISKKDAARNQRAISEKNRRKREVFLVKLIVFLTFYILISLIIAGFIFFSLKTQANALKVNRIDMVFDESRTVKIAGDTLVKDNIVYIPYEKLDLMCNFVLTGDSNKITLIISSGIDYVSFYRNSNLAFIGGSSYRISSPVLFEKDDYYIPLDFINNYMKGIAVEFDEKENVYQLIYTGENITFAGKFPSETEKIDIDTAPSIPPPDTSTDTSEN